MAPPTLYQKCTGAFLAFSILILVISVWIPLIPTLALAIFLPILPHSIRKQLHVILCWIVCLFHGLVVSYSELVFGTMYVMYGNPTSGPGSPAFPTIPANDRALVICNHPTRTDWMFLLGFFMRTNNLHNVKFVLKDDLRMTPFVGWIIQLAGYLFLTRQWAQDESTMASLTEFWRAYSPRIFIVIFPEGTDMTRKSLERSREFAEKNGLPKWDHVLIPRSTGFVSLLSNLTGVIPSSPPSGSYQLSNSAIDAVYDFTVAYSPTHVQSELALLSGYYPAIVHILCERFPVADLPLDDEEALKDWIFQRFQAKEDLLSTFYNSVAYINSRQAAGLPVLDHKIRGSEASLVDEDKKSQSEIGVNESTPAPVTSASASSFSSSVPLLHPHVVLPSSQQRITSVIWLIVSILTPYVLFDQLFSFPYLSSGSKWIIALFLVFGSVYAFTIKKFNITTYIATKIVPTIPASLKHTSTHKSD